MKLHNASNGHHRFIGLTIGRVTVGAYRVTGRWYFTKYRD